HHKSAVFFRNLRASHSRAAKPGIHDQFSCKISLRPLEGASGAWKFQGLLLNPLCFQRLHFSTDLLFLSLLQRQLRAQHYVSLFLRQAGTVSELHFPAGQRTHFSVLIQHRDLADNVLHLSAVSARAPHHRASDGARYAGGELQTGQGCVQNLSRKRREQDTRLDRHCLSLNLCLLKIFIDGENHSPVAFIADQKVASSSQHKPRKIFFPTDLDGCPDLFDASKFHKVIRRTADPERGMACHRLLLQHFVFSDDFTKPSADSICHLLSSVLCCLQQVAHSLSVDVLPCRPRHKGDAPRIRTFCSPFAFL